MQSGAVAHISLVENIFFLFCSFGAKHVTPRSLSARFIGNMVCVEGIVTKCKLNVDCYSRFQPFHSQDLIINY